MGPELVPSTELGIDQVHLKQGPATRLSWRGWQADIHPAGAITVPEQPFDGKSTADLNTLLVTAYATAGIPIHHSDWTIAGPGSTPSAPPARQHLADTVQALRAGRTIASQLWRPKRFDVYACAAFGWEQTAMQAPYALILASLRAALPPHTTLGYYNDHAPNRRAIPDLFSSAINHLTGRQQPPARPSIADSRTPRIA